MLERIKKGLSEYWRFRIQNDTRQNVVGVSLVCLFVKKANEKPMEGFVSWHEWRGKLVVVLTSRTCCRS